MTGRGIVIDITESKLDGRAEDRAFFIAHEDVENSSRPRSGLCHPGAQAIDEITGPEGLELRRSADALLLTLGRAPCPQCRRFRGLSGLGSNSHS